MINNSFDNDHLSNAHFSFNKGKNFNKPINKNYENYNHAIESDRLIQFVEILASINHKTVFTKVNEYTIDDNNGSRIDL